MVRQSTFRLNFTPQSVGILSQLGRNGQAKHISVELTVHAARCWRAARRNGQSKHNSVEPEPGEDDGGGLAGRSGQAKHNSVERGQ